MSILFFNVTFDKISGINLSWQIISFSFKVGGLIYIIFNLSDTISSTFVISLNAKTKNTFDKSILILDR